MASQYGLTPTRSTFRLRRLQPRFARIGCVVGSASFGIQTTTWILAFFALPCRSLRHDLSADDGDKRYIRKRYHTIVLWTATSRQDTLCCHVQTACLYSGRRGIELKNKLRS